MRLPGSLASSLQVCTFAAVLAAGVLGHAGGCSTRSRLAPDSTAPADFALSLTVDETAPGGAGWYVLDADGALRIATGARRADSPVPPVVRQLAPDQVEQVWSQYRSGGLEEAIWESPQTAETMIPAQGSVVFVAAGRARRAAAFAASDARVAATVTTLRSLAWIEHSAIPNP